LIVRFERARQLSCANTAAYLLRRKNGVPAAWMYELGTPIRKSAKSDPVSVPANENVPLNWAFGSMSTCEY
jgi:hypothetical protein